MAEINGWRNSMEDAHLIHWRSGWGFFGVYDGHGGDQCSKWVAKLLGERLDAEGCPVDDAAVKHLILDVDRLFLAEFLPSGSTATMCIVHKPTDASGRHKLRVINAGDSRVILGRRDGTIVDGGGTDQGLTTDHKPNHPSERERIYRCGGHVQCEGGGVARVNGDLAVSRGFGDADYKRTGGPGPEDRPVTADPELGHFECDEADFLLLVCDGVSEGTQGGVCLFPNADVVKLVAKQLELNGGDPGAAAKEVCKRALETDSKDNVTCMVVLLTSAEGDEAHTTELIPGPIIGLSEEKFRKAYQAMAEKVGCSLAECVAKRYDCLEEQIELLEGDADSKEALEALREEQKEVGTPEGSRGSAERKEWFDKEWFVEWTKAKEQRHAERLDMPGSMQDSIVQQIMQHGYPGLPRQDVRKRTVIAPSLDVLKEAVESHSALKWDDRMEDMVGKEGIVVQDDGDGTSNVRFETLGIVAWLPTDVLQNCSEDDSSSRPLEVVCEA